MTLVVPPPPARGHGGAVDAAASKGIPDPWLVVELLLSWLAEG